jgi:hypothetical protein
VQRRIIARLGQLRDPQRPQSLHPASTAEVLAGHVYHTARPAESQVRSVRLALARLVDDGYIEGASVYWPNRHRLTEKGGGLL